MSTKQRTEETIPATTYSYDQKASIAVLSNNVKSFFGSKSAFHV